ncbi:magnesium/cobalt transporter CorA [Bacillus taeanensis]|uniref:Magnesium transport protein CorA n=1 Tax=Bacillus taeanensis TaxID=273032 RepID=A0A366XRT4_9BACI|nr:magnesium/cobalt transporter CorA [Bacillus taeanensis]RBW69080.1 magnesium and cobalt transport protein CorA [Bacillus taeanensis]
MIRILAVKQNLEIEKNLSVEQLNLDLYSWYWADFSEPIEEENNLLSSYFHFHPLAIEDCFHILQRPKLDYYKKANFFVTHALNQTTLEPEEIDLFIGKNFVVTYHHRKQHEIDKAWKQVEKITEKREYGPYYVLYLLMDSMVDNYFPIVYKIEDALNQIENNPHNKSMKHLMEDLFDIRSQLLQLRHTIIPMRDLLYRILYSSHLNIREINDLYEYFSDIYDHLLRLTEKIDSNREMTADIRDSYLSINTHHMNRVMMVLTVITTIFMPLTFIAGIYGMNFMNMPELTWEYSYFIVLAVMAGIALSMFIWFKQKGWFDN